MERSADRRARITTELTRAGLDYELVAAADGQYLDLHDEKLVDPSFFAKCPFPPGAAGCALSHLRVYRKILEDGRDQALVLEDDVLLPDDLSDLADDLVPHLTGAEVALLNFARFPPGSLEVSRQSGVELLAGRMLGLPIDVRGLLNAGAYVITRQACARMVEAALPIRATADDWQSFYESGVVDRVRCVVPEPVSKNPGFGSTIGFYSLGGGVKALLLGPLVRRKIPILHQVLRYRRRRILRRWYGAEVVDSPFVMKPSRIE